jgi:hypothetical protein
MELTSRRRAHSETQVTAVSDDEADATRSQESYPRSYGTDESDLDADDDPSATRLANSSFYSSNKLWRTMANPPHDYDFLESTEGFLNEYGEVRPSQRSNGPPPSTTNACCTSDLIPSGRIRLLFLLFLLISICAILLPNDHSTDETKPTVRKYKGAPQYICPSSSSSSAISSSSNNNGKVATSTTTFINDNYEDHIFPGYRNNSDILNLISQNLTLYKNSFRTMEYMNWNRTYDQVKDGTKEWKTSKYLPNLKKTGASIFECSCGIGLNLLMTLELLLQGGATDGVRDLHLYGTDYSPAAALSANVFLDTILQEASSVSGGKRGAVCAADATQLSSFIPEHSFDLVFTSHILPTPNPWDFDSYSTTMQLFDDTLRIERQREICQRADWKSEMLYQLAQDRQEAFYGRWVSEMIRIAKPGAIVALEHIPDPTVCSASTGPDVLTWSGGVPPTFWSTGVDRFHWDIDPTSIEIEIDDTLFPDQHHYHVLMKKHRPTG